MRVFFLAAMTLTTALHAETFVQGDVTVTKTTLRKLELDVDVPAPVDQVWAAMTTVEGLKTWIAPDARVDLRVGGDWLAMFPGAKPGGGTIIRVDPKKAIVIHAMAPERYPEVRNIGTDALFTFEPRGDNMTHVRLEQTGWRESAEWAEAFDYLSKGNAMLLNGLRKRFVSGPVDWTPKK